MTWATAFLLAAGALLALMALAGLIFAFAWGVAVLVMGAADDEPYEFEPLHLIRRD